MQASVLTPKLKDEAPAPSKELCLLSLVGGGVRGLSSLYILKLLMESLNPKDPSKPCEYFDMIGGTSTGGEKNPLLMLLQAPSAYLFDFA